MQEVQTNKPFLMECPACGETTDHYPVTYGGITIYLECEPCMLSRD